MKLTVFLAVLIGILVLACSTVEARVRVAPDKILTMINRSIGKLRHTILTPRLGCLGALQEMAHFYRGKQKPLRFSSWAFSKVTVAHSSGPILFLKGSVN